MIPAPDALPLPAPAIIFKILLVFTFLLHVIPMNLVLGERDRESIGAFLDAIHYGSKENAYKRYMPPFLGSRAERGALAAYLSTLNAGRGEK